jgi:hypothetical protein
MTRFAHPLIRFLWSVTALLMLHWNALAFENGDPRMGTAGFAHLQPAGHVAPFARSEIGRPFAAEERPSGTTKPPAEEQAMVPSRNGIRLGHVRFHVDALGGMERYSHAGRAFNARAPPIDA